MGTPVGTDKSLLWQPARRLPCALPGRALVFVSFQYDHMGADKHAVTAKVVQLFSYVNGVSCFWSRAGDVWWPWIRARR